MKRNALCLLLGIVLCLPASLALAGYRNLLLTNGLVRSGTVIVDIRTEPEWRETGVVPGSVLLTFFRADGSYDLDGFVAELARYAAPGEKIALLCRSGNRSAKLARLLATRGYTDVINVSGGIRSAAGHGVKLVPYPSQQ